MEVPQIDGFQWKILLKHLKLDDLGVLGGTPILGKPGEPGGRSSAMFENQRASKNQVMQDLPIGVCPKTTVGFTDIGTSWNTNQMCIYHGVRRPCYPETPSEWLYLVRKQLRPGPVCLIFRLPSCQGIRHWGFNTWDPMPCRRVFNILDPLQSHMANNRQLKANLGRKIVWRAEVQCYEFCKVVRMIWMWYLSCSIGCGWYTTGCYMLGLVRSWCGGNASTGGFHLTVSKMGQNGWWDPVYGQIRQDMSRRLILTFAFFLFFVCSVVAELFRFTVRRWLEFQLWSPVTQWMRRG